MSHDTTTEPEARPRRRGTKYLPINEAIPAIIGELPEIGKESRMNVPGQRYNYRGIDDIIPHLKGLMAKYGVHVQSRYKLVTDEPYETSGGARQTRVVLKGTFRFVATDGSRTDKIVMFGEARDSGDKSFNKAETAAYKYALIETFLIGGGDDPDDPDDHASVPSQPRQERPVAVPGQEFPDGAVMPEGGPWALNSSRVLVYRDTPNFEALMALGEALEAAGVKDLVREWAETEGIPMVRGYDEPGIARVVEYAEGLLRSAEQDADDEGPAVPLDPDVVLTDADETVDLGDPDPVDKMRAQLADKGIELPDDVANLSGHMAETVAERRVASDAREQFEGDAADRGAS